MWKKYILSIVQFWWQKRAPKTDNLIPSLNLKVVIGLVKFELIFDQSKVNTFYFNIREHSIHPFQNPFK